jgi:CDP-ribitol ribitolphosphotransferase
VIAFARKWTLKAVFALLTPLPLHDRVVLASTHTSHLSGNLEFIADELARRGMSSQVVVLTNAARRGVLGKLATLAAGARAEYYLATSRVFVVDDYFFPLYVVTPKPGTTVIQTWHASGAFKKVGYSVLDKSFGASAELVRHVAIHSNYDVILVGSQTAVPAYSEAFHQPAERFVSSIGIPRTDLFFDAEGVERTSAAVRAKYSVPEGKRVVLYAPTFRGDSKHVAAYHDSLDLAVMHERLGDEMVLLLRLHPFVASHTAIDPALAGFAINVSDHPDINELMLVTDVLVTDYSSAIFEFSLLGRPMAFFAPDFEAYEAERGFYFPYAESVPGPIFTTSEALAEYLASGKFDTERVARFRERSFEIADGHASERFVDRLVLPALDHGNAHAVR